MGAENVTLYAHWLLGTGIVDDPYLIKNYTDLKWISENIEEALIAAQAQIEREKYDVELLEAGLSSENIIKIAVAFQGKKFS